MSSKSISPEREQVSARKQQSDGHKVFLTNLNGQINEQQIENQVRKLFEKHGQVEKLSLKKHKKGYYYFGFLQFPKGFNAFQAVKALDQYPLFGKNMKVRQDRQSEGCFKCGSMNHFARECPQNRDRRRSYSNERRNKDSRYPDNRDNRFNRDSRDYRDNNYNRYNRDYKDNRDNRDKYQRRDRDRDYHNRDRERYERHDRNDRDRERDPRDNRDKDRQRERDNRDNQRHDRRRRRSKSYSDSRSSSESSYHHSRPDRKDRKDKDKRRRSRS